MDTVRLISRDSFVIASFDNQDLLKCIQRLCQLDDIEPNLYSNFESDTQAELLTLKALKSASNLIYNAKFAQKYFSNESVRSSLIHFASNFSHESILQNTIESTSANISLFKLKIVFLLTVFSKENRDLLRSDLLNKLIHLIDGVSLHRLRTNQQDQSNSYCLLKQIDILFLVELLKIVYNLTMDVESVRQNAASILNVEAKIAYKESSELAHDENLAHLVKILRDLLACKLEEHTQFDSKDLALNQSKLNDLHSNIINLLTNIPTFYFKHLIAKNEIKSSEPLQDSFLESRRLHQLKRVHRFTNLKSNAQEKTDFDLVNLIDYEHDLNFKNYNLESVGLVLSYMSQHAYNYLSKKEIKKKLILANPNIDSVDHLYPVLMLLSLVSKTNRLIHQYCRLKVLPPLQKADLISLPQTGLSIRNRLCKLMTDANLQLKRLSAQFLFILCKESVDKLVKFTGYGNAAGLLAEAGLMLSKTGDRAAYSSDSNESDVDEYKKYQNDINPITGRIELSSDSSDEEKNKKKAAKFANQPTVFKRANKQDIFEGMSEEQKEYEAIKLVNALDKLTRLGAAGIKPATIGPDGRPIEVEHVLQLQEQMKLEKNLDEPD